jgi:two-component system LytT family response regulator
MKIRVLIVDDEEIAREGIRRRLTKFPDAEIVGECANGIKAVAEIKRRKPDLVFLDVQMPGLDGFEVIEKIGVERMPMVVFVTAYDKYAINAFGVHAFDYLLKPFDEERFESTMHRVLTMFQGIEGNTENQRLMKLLEDLKKGQLNLERNLQSSTEFLERMVIKKAGRIFFINIDEIEWFEAANNYIRLHSKGDEYLVRESLNNLESRIDPRRFVRINRSIIVNTGHIKELHPLFHGDYAVILKDGTELRSSRNFRKNFASLLNK